VTDSAPTLADVRHAIDKIDTRIVSLLADREVQVRRAAILKTTEEGVRAPARVEQVIAKVRALAAESGASPEVVERVYRAMIGAFIDLELDSFQREQTAGRAGQGE
jgi:isochorismate pyruvate lyase